MYLHIRHFNKIGCMVNQYSITLELQISYIMKKYLHVRIEHKHAGS